MTRENGSEQARSAMADVFISYSKADRAVAEALANNLISLGFIVWWDFALYAGDDFHDVIRREIALAKATIVIWSDTAVASKWVRGEAQEALARTIHRELRDEMMGGDEGAGWA